MMKCTSLLSPVLAIILVGPCHGDDDEPGIDPVSSSVEPASPGSDPQPRGPAGAWSLVLAEEFDGPSLDPDVWTPHYAWWPTTINGELQYFDPDRPNVSGGTLRLTADRTAQDGMAYTSGAISSHGKFRFRYGVAEVRAKLPAGNGLWPAFWTMPEGGGWPPEIDVVEGVGAPDQVHFNLHFEGGDMGAPAFTGLDVRQWHTYTVDWRPERIDWYVDGTLRASYADASRIPRRAMYLLADLAVGGSWPGPPDATTTFPATCEFDYIRVWK